MKKNNLFNLIILIIWLVLVFILIQFHENWRDEAQAWFIVRDLSFFDILKQLKYEGHPCLWYIILLPWAKLGFNYCIINYISYFFVAISVYLILFKTNFNNLLKLIFCFSPGFIYFFPVIARNYCLIPPLIIAIMLLHKKRQHIILYNVLILLLLNTHLLVAPFCLILIFLQFLDLIKKVEKNKIIGISISLLGLLLLLIQLFGCKEINDETSATFYLIPFLSSISIYFFACSISVFLCKNNKKSINYIILLFMSAFGTYFIINYTGFFSEQKIVINSLFIIYSVYFINNKMCKVCLIFCFLAFFSSGYKEMIYDLQYNYSSSKELADFINININKEENFIVIDDYAISSIAGYSENYQYINIFENKSNLFITWSKNRNLKRKNFFESSNLCEYLENEMNNYSSNYIIITENYFEILNCKKWELLYTTKRSIRSGEQYKLYFLNK